MPLIESLYLTVEGIDEGQLTWIPERARPFWRRSTFVAGGSARSEKRI